MAVLVICGSGRGAGKTAVGCALVAALSKFRWVVAKVSLHTNHLQDEIWEETDRESDKDTGRYLTAGASRAFLIGGARDSQAAVRITQFIAQVRDLAPECDAVLVESNRSVPASIARPGEGTCCLTVLSGSEAEWKASLFDCLVWVDGLVFSDGTLPEAFSEPFSQRPDFRLEPGQWSTPEMIQYVMTKIRAR